MYVLMVLCLVSAAVALPTPENLHTNSPSLPAPPELPSDVKEEHDAQVPVPKPLIHPTPQEEDEVEVSLPEPLVDSIPQGEHDAQIRVTEPLRDPIPLKENDAKVPVPKPSVDPTPEEKHEAQVPVPKPLVDPIPLGDNDAKYPLLEPLIYPIPFDSQEIIWQKFDDIFEPEKSGEIITLNSKDMMELLAIEKLFGSQAAAEYEESIIASKVAKQSENGKESSTEEKKDSKSEELQKNKDSNPSNKPELVEFYKDAEPGLSSWFQDLPLLNNHYYQLQNYLGNPLSAENENQLIYIIEDQPEPSKH